MNIETLQAFLGWCTVINLGILIFSTLMIALLGKTISKVHSQLFGIEKTELSRLYFQYLAHYKIAILVFSLIPYIALRIVV